MKDLVIFFKNLGFDLWVHGFWSVIVVTWVLIYGYVLEWPTKPSNTGTQIPHRWTPENRSLVMMNGGGGEVTDPYGAVANLPKNRNMHSPHKKPHCKFCSHACVLNTFCLHMLRFTFIHEHRTCTHGHPQPSKLILTCPQNPTWRYSLKTNPKPKSNTHRLTPIAIPILKSTTTTKP